MPEAIKVLGQVAPAATTLTALYTVPAATSAVASTITICNHNATTVTVRLAVAPAGAADATAHYILRDLKVLKNDFVALTIGLTLAATDVVRVYSDTTDVSFHIYGTEIT